MGYPNFSNEANDASELIREACGWHIWPSVSQTLTLDGPGGLQLMLPTMLLTAVTSITELRRDATTPTSLVDGVDYYWSADGSIERIGYYWTNRPRGVTVTFTHGYTDKPPILTTLAAGVGARLAANPRRLVQQSAGQVSESYGAPSPYSGGLLQEEYSVLARYRRTV